MYAIICDACAATGTNRTVTIDPDCTGGTSEPGAAPIGVALQLTGWYEREDGSRFRETWSFHLCPDHYAAARALLAPVQP